MHSFRQVFRRPFVSDLEPFSRCEFGVAAGRFRRELEDSSGPCGRDLASSPDELLVPRFEHVVTALARSHALEQAVALLQHTPQAREGAGVARLDLDEHLVEKSPPELGTSLDEAKVVRPEEHDPEITRQINCPAPRAVDLDRASRPLTLDVQSDRDLSTQLAGLDPGLDARTWTERANELQLASRPRRARERQHRDR